MDTKNTKKRKKKKDSGLVNFREEIYCFQSSEQFPVSYFVTGITLPDAHYEIFRKNSQGIGLEYVYEGEGVIQNGEQFFKIKAGDAFILHANAYHHYFANPKNPWKKIWIWTVHNCDYLRHLIKDYGLQETVYLPGFCDSRLFEIVLETVKTQQGGAQRKIEFLLHEIVASFADHIGRQTALSDDMQRLKRFLDQNVQTNLDLGECCRYLGIARSQLISKFKKAYGVPPMKYVKTKKIEAAKNMLRTSRASVAEIAQSLAFYDAYHFSKTFKSITGVSPTAYRKAAQVENK